MTKESAVTHVADQQANGPEESLRQAAAAALEKDLPLRLKVTIQLWHATQGQYISWKGQIWKLEVGSIAEAKEFQRSLEAFFDLVALCQPAGAAGVLEKVLGAESLARRSGSGIAGQSGDGRVQPAQGEADDDGSDQAPADRPAAGQSPDSPLV